MAKFSRYPKLPKSKIQEIIIDLCEAIASTHNSQEAAQLLTDLLGRQELEMIAKRLRVAEMLLGGSSYADISTELKTSPSTVARVQVWLQSSGEGYRLAADRTKQKRRTRELNQQPFKLTGIKKKYPIYYWPQILLEQWVKTAAQKDKKTMLEILAKVDKKTETYKELEVLLRQNLKINQ